MLSKIVTVFSKDRTYKQSAIITYMLLKIYLIQCIINLGSLAVHLYFCVTKIIQYPRVIIITQRLNQKVSNKAV